MAIPNSRPLMRQKVNVHQTLLDSYKRNMAHELRNVIHKSPLEFTDYGTSFVHKERTYEIMGFTENSHVILKEMHEGNPYYWECTQPFVQMKLDRKNHAYTEIAGIKTTVPMDFEPLMLVLPPIRASRKKLVEEVEDLPKDEFDTVVYNEEEHSTINEQE
jgi:hypothetical protein